MLLQFKRASIYNEGNRVIMNCENITYVLYTIIYVSLSLFEVVIQ